jgi:hypothetical protein
MNYSSAQLTKKTWLVGGTGLFNSTQYKNGRTVGFTPGFKTTTIQLSPNIAYFFVNKFAAGLKTSYEYYQERLLSASDISSRSTTYNFGPFVRYYFLSLNKKINLLIDGSYQHGVERVDGLRGSPLEKFTKNTLAIAAGPVVYFNSSVGLELLVGLSNESYNKFAGENNTVQMGLGLQVHL